MSEPREKPLVRVQDLGVRYDMRSRHGRSLKRFLFQAATGEAQRREFWALRHVSWELQQGEALALVGRNGAGKSTLCLALAGLLPPDEGKVDVDGVVAPILGLGVGFNRDMTGRENIYLGGTLMGLSRKELAGIEKDVLQFAEIDAFADQPVRTYSTGMRARLAFAISTIFTPDLLLLDEVLSVGDQRFRQKSRARMQEMMKQAKGIILVSHSVQTIRELCTRAIWLDRGAIRMDGPVDEVLEAYESV